MLLSIIIVNYNSGTMLYDCLQSIYDSRIGFEHEIIVIDNASVDDSIIRAKRTFTDVVYIENSENLGFAKANNQGIQMARGEYILLQNPDTLVIDNAINRLIGYAKEYPDIGIAGGRLLNEDKTLQHSIRRYPTVTNQVFEAFFLHKLLPRQSKRFGEVVVDNKAYENRVNVDWVIGAIMLTRREAVSQIGMLDESFFLYAEEIDWCYRMKQGGWKIVYCPDAVFVHFLGKTRASLQLYVQHLKARRQFNFKHFHRRKAQLLDVMSLMFVLNRALLFLALSIAKPSEETVRMRSLYYQSGKALLEMMAKGAASKHIPQRGRL